MVIFEANEVTYTVAQRTLIDHVSLTVDVGTLVALVGPNGAGKSTLLKLVAGEIRPTAGSIMLDGRPLTSYTKQALALRRAVMPQDVLMAFAFTSQDVVTMGRYPHGGNGERPVDRTVVERSMVQTETWALRDRKYPTLSGGEQARVTLARVLAQEAPMVLLDEPTASLDPRHQHLVMGLARKITDEGGLVVAVLHDLNLASIYADQVVVLADGVIRANGSPARVLTSSILEPVFNTPFRVIEHPSFPTPLVLSMPS